MTIKRFFSLLAGLLAGCTTIPAGLVTAPGSVPVAKAVQNHGEPAKAAFVYSPTVDAYKEALARQIAAANASKIYAGQPQALLRSVIVLKFSVDADGHLVKSEILRSNHDLIAEGTALSSLRGAAPFPRPAPHLLARGKLELFETWLFNNDGRFQLRSIAQPQKSE